MEKVFKKRSDMLKWLSERTLVNATVSGLVVKYEEEVKKEK